MFKGGCYFCNVPQRARDCSSKGKLNALVAAASDSSNSEESASVSTW